MDEQNTAFSVFAFLSTNSNIEKKTDDLVHFESHHNEVVQIRPSALCQW
jgi:hypothetical protein